ncbi:choice-of-anchor B family protein [Alteromonas halophila]|uniref:Calx-beta domain-containing protein n=1 Tax=Alteromonas halophila TaxID=516698 RepID=A0A918MUQ9_9ALTE|nr:choice-of-anchor B family protein [Alteromonas halophila]GGW72591.1 hypothetical protein GCM10007391_00040 [Alteromonas halophila]
MRTCLILTIVLLTGTLSQAAHAHSEHDKARFVASSGSDSGRCDNRFRPCKTIAYAASQASKGDTVLVADGHYPLTSKQDLFYLVSELVPVKGGYSRLDHFQVQNADGNETFLSGVPGRFSEALYNQGFSVITDGKSGQAQEIADYADHIMSLMNEPQSAAACTNGESAGFKCNNLSLLGHVPLSELPTGSSSASDIWGHVDLNTMREYAIIGLRRGVAVVDVTDPTSPAVIGSISGTSTTWRDIKVYQYYKHNAREWRAYAYVTADLASDGLRVIDLNNLPDSISLATTVTSDRRAHNVYISNIDYTFNTALPEGTPQVHLTGSENNGGAWRSYSLDDAAEPELGFVQSQASRSDYTHDASSLFISDSRATTDCVNATASGCSVMLDFNENMLRLWDHSQTDDAVELSSESYPNAAYTHSGWWSEDRRYVIVHDELDESESALNTTVHFFDISDLTAPQLVATWTGDSKAIDHNGFVRGDRYYMSNYEKGLTVLDISDPTAPSQIASFDTFPGSDNTAFNGAWGVYPYLPSGNLLVSDIQGGLYILNDESVDMETNTVALTQTELLTGDATTVSLTVTRTGSDALDIGYSTLYGATTDTDITLQQGVLSWSAGDTADKTIEVDVAANTDDEGDEQFMVRLENPQGGSIQPGKGQTVVTIEGADSFAGSAGLVRDNVTVLETDGSIALLVQRLGGSEGELSLSAEITGGSANAGEDFTLDTQELTWADGETEDKFIAVSIVNDEDNEGDEILVVALNAASENMLGDIAQTEITIRDDEANEAPVVNAGADQEVNTRTSVQLNGAASDPEERLTGIEWSQTSGEAVTLDDADTLRPSFTAPDADASLTFTLTATDEFGVQASDTVNIEVVASEEGGGGDSGENGDDTPAPPANTTSNSGGGGSTGIFALLLISLAALRRRYR